MTSASPTLTRQVTRAACDVASPDRASHIQGKRDTHRQSGQVVVLVLADISSRYRLWGYARFVLQRLPLRNVKGLVFSKIMGSGFEGGFGLRPSGSRQALFCLFDSNESADCFIHSELAQEYAKRSSEFCVAKLRAYASRGSWSGTSIEVTDMEPSEGPVFTLTRASIKPSRAWAFWKMQPSSETALKGTKGCLFATGVGEAPLLRQATLSLWANTAAMDAYARSGAHMEAIRAAYAGQFFSESMFVRFVPLMLRGDWRGNHYA